MVDRRGERTLHLMELVRVTRAHADVSAVAGLDDVVERVHRLLDRCVIVESGRQLTTLYTVSQLYMRNELCDLPVALQDIDIVELQPLKGRLDRVKDVLPAQAVCIHELDRVEIARADRAALTLLEHGEEDL